MPQIEAFVAAVGISKKENIRDAALAARAARGSNKDFKKIMRELG